MTHYTSPEGTTITYNPQKDTIINGKKLNLGEFYKNKIKEDSIKRINNLKPFELIAQQLFTKEEIAAKEKDIDAFVAAAPDEIFKATVVELDKKLSSMYFDEIAIGSRYFTKVNALYQRMAGRPEKVWWEEKYVERKKNHVKWIKDKIPGEIKDKNEFFNAFDDLVLDARFWEYYNGLLRNYLEILKKKGIQLDQDNKQLQKMLDAIQEAKKGMIVN